MTKVITVDVRPDIYYGHEPFPRIMRAVAKLEPGEKLLLLAPFEPVPLYRMMGARGFSYTANPLPSGGWEVLFEREAAPGQIEWTEIDVRGLEPPMPLVRVIEALEALPPDNGLIVHTDRRPMLLLDELPRRGFTGESEPAPGGGGFVTRIQRG
jgi:uncharacterized protein (DUF2249 family)